MNLERAWSTDPASIQGLNANLLQLNAMPKDASEPYVPLLVFNGTAVESGCRVNTSVLGANGHAANEPTLRCLSSPYRAASSDVLPKDSIFAATVDLVDLLCADDNLPLSTAALLAGRFPFVSPAGHALQCRQKAETDSNPLETYIVDGGYLENSGAATALELWNALAPLVEQHNRDSSLPAIVPFFIQIDNVYAEPAASARLPTQMQLIVPFITLGSTLIAKSIIIELAFRANRPCGGRSNGSINLLGAVVPIRHSHRRWPNEYSAAGIPSSEVLAACRTCRAMRTLCPKHILALRRRLVGHSHARRLSIWWISLSLRIGTRRTSSVVGS